MIEAIKAVQIEHSDDLMKSIVPTRGTLFGKFKIQSDDYARYKDKKICTRRVELKLTPICLMQGDVGYTL